MMQVFCWIIYLVTTGIFLLVGCTSFFQIEKEKYSFLRHFPYEMDKDSQGRSNFWVSICLALAIGSELLLAASLFLVEARLFLDYVFFIFCLLLAVMKFIMMTTSLRILKLHLSTASSFFIGSVLFSVLFLFYRLRDPDATFSLWGLCFFLPVMILLLIALFHPKLKSWAFLQKQETRDGVLLSRGKVFVLACYEWMFFLSNLLFYSFLIISIYLP